MTTETISIQIPEGTEPGDTLEFEANGQSLELVVPLGSQPGDVLEIQVAARGETTSGDETQKDENDDIIINIDIGEGRQQQQLTFYSRLPTDHADEASPSAASGTESNEHEDETCDGTFSLPWQSGIEMAHSWQVLGEAISRLGTPPIRRILELGSGLGVVGISFAAAAAASLNDSSTTRTGSSSNILTGFSSILVGDHAHITLTDLPEAIPLLNFNLEQNRSVLLPPSNITVTTHALRWSMERLDDDHPLSKEPPFDCVLGSDLLYNIEYIPHLVATLKRVLHPMRGIVLLAVRWRKPDLERAFFRDSGLDWQLVLPPLESTASCCCQLSWNEFGDASNEASNKYFHQTQISVKGKPKALADITEEQADDLPREEFLAWERSFIQMYLGRPKKEQTSI